MIIKTIPEKAPKVNAAVDGRIMFSNEKAESILLTLQPSESIPEHTNPFDVLIVGIKGSADLTAENQNYTLEPCQTIFISSGKTRMISNLSESDPLKVMVVKMF
jgi:quercetin dioxygenase-like cupin family protein